MDIWVDTETLVIRASGPVDGVCFFEGREKCIKIVSDLNPIEATAVRSDSGEITLHEDPTKVAQKTADQWTSVRAQQRQKLYESDWTCSVIDPPPEILAQRDQWLQYRADLRAVTTQSDPFAIVWPLEPVVETPVVEVSEPVVEVSEPAPEVTEVPAVVEVREPQ